LYVDVVLLSCYFYQPLFVRILILSVVSYLLLRSMKTISVCPLLFGLRTAQNCLLG
jgi:hypothetical protein